jgi:HlyD family secretion protein
MKNMRFMMFSGMAGLIGAGIVSLSFYQEAGHTASLMSNPTAYVEATNIDVSFKLAGRISEILVKEGAHVQKGQLLARMENKELQSKVNQAEAVKQGAQAKQIQGSDSVSVTSSTADQQVNQAKAAVAAAEAHLEAIQNGARKEDRAKAEIQVQTTNKTYQIATDNLNRIKALFAQGALPKAKVDEVTLDYQKAKAEYEAADQQQKIIQNGARPEEIKAAIAQVEQAQAALAMAEAGRGQVKLRQDEVLAANAGVSQAQATIDEAKTYLDYTDLRAPADGVITSKSGELGELIAAGFPVFTLEADDERWADFYFSEKDITQLHVGDPVKLNLIADGKLLVGKISVIQPAADFAIQKATQDMGDTDIRSFGVKVSLPKLPTTVHTGMTVQWEGKGAAKK